MPYPGKWLTAELDERISRTALARAIAGPERAAYLRTWRRGRADAYAYAAANAENYARLLSFWPSVVDEIWDDERLASAVLEMSSGRDEGSDPHLTCRREDEEAEPQPPERSPLATRRRPQLAGNRADPRPCVKDARPHALWPYQAELPGRLPPAASRDNRHRRRHDRHGARACLRGRACGGLPAWQPHSHGRHARGAPERQARALPGARRG